MKRSEKLKHLESDLEKLEKSQEEQRKTYLKYSRENYDNIDESTLVEYSRRRLVTWEAIQRRSTEILVEKIKLHGLHFPSSYTRPEYWNSHEETGMATFLTDAGYERAREILSEAEHRYQIERISRISIWISCVSMIIVVFSVFISPLIESFVNEKYPTNVVVRGVPEGTPVGRILPASPLQLKPSPMPPFRQYDQCSYAWLISGCPPRLSQ